MKTTKLKISVKNVKVKDLIRNVKVKDPYSKVCMKKSKCPNVHLAQVRYF